MITSSSNSRVKQVIAWTTRARERRKDKVFIAEGIKMFTEAPLKLVREVYVSESLLKKLPEESEEFRDKLNVTGYETVSDEVFAKMSDTLTPQGILSVLTQPSYTMEELLDEENPLLVLLEDLQDPGNLGTILRTGEGAGVTGVIMTGGCVDLFNPKVVRSTMGSLFRVKFCVAEDLKEVLPVLHEKGINTYAAHLKGENYYEQFQFNKPTAFLIGNEGNGLKKETADLAGSYLKIPMEGRLESLNAAVATAVLLYEAHRQRHL